jgi:hypothetical protein
VLEAVLDGQRGVLPGALIVSAVLSAVALFLAFKAPTLDRRKETNSHFPAKEPA